MRIWIDTASGAWGDANDLKVIEIDEAKIEHLNEMSDSEIIDFGNNNGMMV